MNVQAGKCSTLARALAALALAPLLAGGCASVQTPKEDIVIPPPPAVGRFKLIRSFASENDLKQGFFSKLFNILVPHEKKAVLAGAYGVALSPDEKTLYVSSPVTAQVFAVDLEAGDFRTLKTGKGLALTRPLGVGVDAAGSIYVADRALNSVLVFRPDLSMERRIGGDKLYHPAGVAIDREAQLLYVINDPERANGAQSVEVYSLRGDHIRTIGGKASFEDGFFALPSGLGISRTGELYVTDRLSGRIQVFDREGRFLRKLGEGGRGAVGRFDKPYGVAFDSLGDIYVADATQGIHVLNEDFQPLMPLNGGVLGFPAFIAISRTNRIYVTDNTRYCVHEFQLINTTEADVRRRSPAVAPAAPPPPASPPAAAAPATPAQ